MRVLSVLCVTAPTRIESPSGDPDAGRVHLVALSLPVTAGCDLAKCCWCTVLVARQSPLLGPVALEDPAILQRSLLVDRIARDVREDNILIYAPPGTGKTSLMNFLRARYPRMPLCYLSCGRVFYRAYSVPPGGLGGVDPLDLLTAWLKCDPTLPIGDALAGRIIILDDAHVLYSFPHFWAELLKPTTATAQVAPVRVIAVTTVFPSTVGASPAGFRKRVCFHGCFSFFASLLHPP